MRAPPPVWSCRHDSLIGRELFRQPFVAAPILRKQTEPQAVMEAQNAPPRQRSKIWDFNNSLHCSIIGTCLSTGELRQVLGKLSLARADATDHDLHGTAVSLACRHDQAARLLNKALDQRHRLCISQFSRVRSEAEVRSLWREAVGRGDIPGAYWATLTHPATGHTLIREAFGEVHMLSHLVGAANRADIRRLRELERRQSELEAALARQQAAFRDTVVARDARIAELERALLAQLRSGHDVTVRAEPAGDEAVAKLVLTLEKRLSAEADRRVTAEERLVKLRGALNQEVVARRAAEAKNHVLAAELEALETRAIAESPGGSVPQSPVSPRRLDGETLLYVGGRSSQIAHLRQAVEHMGGAFLHHDGGREQNTDLLAGLIGRADLVLFPVDCISHDAALNIKRLCRQAQKRFVPLRAASLASLLLAVQRMGAEADVSEEAA